MAEDIREELSKALSAQYADYAEMVADPMSDVDPYPAPFLDRSKIYKVLYYHPNQPILFYVGYLPGKKGYFLTGSLENFVKMARDDRVSIRSAVEAAKYVEVALEVTRSMSELVYIVSSVDDVEFQGNLDDDEERVKEQFRKKYRSRITAPKGEPAGDGYHVTAFVVSNGRLDRYSVMVSKKGDLAVETTTLEANLPLMIGG